jgi:hypothetical protein
MHVVTESSRGGAASALAATVEATTAWRMRRTKEKTPHDAGFFVAKRELSSLDGRQKASSRHCRCE